MKNQLVSVIIPVYNVEKYLEECIDSVLNQTYKNIEIILVDDGSTDSSGQICDRYASVDNIKVFHQNNSGLSATRNAGVKQAQGKYIYFLDSDDYIVADAIEKLCSIAENNNADIVFFDAESFADENCQMKIKQSYIRKHIYETQEGIKTLEQMQKNKEYHSVAWGMLLNSEFLLQNNIEFIPDIYYEDMVYTYQAFCLAERVAQCSDALYRRRYRENSIMTSKKSKKYFDSCVTVYKTVRDFSVENDLSETDVAKKYIARLAFNIFNNYYKLNKNDKSACGRDFKAAKKDILENNAYGEKALKMKCYGNFFWFAYKVYENTLGRF